MTHKPEYGTCPRCGQPRRIKNDGWTYNHSRKESWGSMVATIRCAGGRAPEYEAWKASFA